jgi:single-strand DNA-binding protein
MVNVTAEGNLTETPGQRTMPSGVVKSWFRIASSKRRQDPQTNEWQDAETVFINVVCWGPLAGRVAQCLRKGDSVVVAGRLMMREFDDRDGAKRQAFEILARAVGPNLSRTPVDIIRPQRRAMAAPEGNGGPQDAHDAVEDGEDPDEPEHEVGPEDAERFAGDATAALA